MGADTSQMNQFKARIKEAACFKFKEVSSIPPILAFYVSTPKTKSFAVNYVTLSYWTISHGNDFIQAKV
jgi:hypothetical protein